MCVWGGNHCSRLSVGGGGGGSRLSVFFFFFFFFFFWGGGGGGGWYHCSSLKCWGNSYNLLSVWGTAAVG